MRLIIPGGASRVFVVGLSAWLAACGAGGAGDGLDVEAADEGEGLRASTTVDGESIDVAARVLREAATTPEGEPYENEVVVATVTGADGTVYAELRHTVLTDDLAGTIGGQDLVSPASGARRAGIDWVELAGSRTGVVLGEVSRRAASMVEAEDFPEIDAPLRLVADAGPYLTSLADSDDFGACGDGKCSVAENDENCPADCGCAAETTCGGVAPFGCYCGDDCAESGDCCADSCETCGHGCPPCEDEQTPCSNGCELASNVCDGVADCPAGQDEAQCSPTCDGGEMACDDGTCIGVGHWCDGKNDCGGGEDELCSCGFCEAG